MMASAVLMFSLLITLWKFIKLYIYDLCTLLCVCYTLITSTRKNVSGIVNYTYFLNKQAKSHSPIHTTK